MTKKKTPVTVSVVLTEEEAIAVRYALQCMREDIGDVAEPSDPRATWSAIRIDLNDNTYWAIEKAYKILNKQLGL